ncbi:MAG: PAS domain S-box protein, partial [Bacteroidota bacterium]
RDEAMKKNATHLEFSVYGVRKKKGDIIYVKDFISILRDESGEAVEFLGYFIDVTKEKLAEKSLIDNQQKYFALFSQANDAILIIDRDKIVDCNSKSAEILGYTREEMLEIDILKLSPEIQPSGTPSAEKRARKIQDAYEGKYDTFYWQYRRKNGDLFDAEVSLTMVELNGKRYLHAIVRDISDRKKIEKDLRTSEQKYRRLLDAIPDTIFIFDKDGNYLDYKPDVLGALAIEKEKIIGKNLKDFFSGDEEKEFRGKINKALEGKSVESIRYYLDSPKGIRNFEARISMLSENKVFVIVRDFTDKDR